MYTEQIAFIDITQPQELRQEIAGIAIYNDVDDEMETIICGCCGGMIDPKDVKVTRHFKMWMPLVDAIIGE